MNNNYCVIMAGGIGSRFWPLSRTSLPKQFLDILGTGRTLIQQTYDRFVSTIPKENIYIVSNEMYKDQILEQLPELSEDQILLEPMRRNTAPCIAYAAHKISKINPEALMVVAPSDHLVLKESEFVNVLKKGLNFVSETDNLLTLGIKPSRPETGYGYIQLDTLEPVELNKSLRKVKTFTEKPDLPMAKVFMESGDFFWNSGIFFWSSKSILKAMDTHLPEVNNLFIDIIPSLSTKEENKSILKTYEACKNISIDYGVMEKADNVYVLCSDFGWSDLGTWGSLYEHKQKDEMKNSIRGAKTFIYESKNCLIDIPDDKLLVLQGLDNFIVVDTGDVLLICNKNEEQKIKQYTNDVKLKLGSSML